MKLNEIINELKRNETEITAKIFDKKLEKDTLECRAYKLREAIKALEDLK